MSDGHNFSRPQTLSALPQSGLEVRIEAKPQERDSIAAFLDLPALDQLTAELLVAGWRGAGVRVTGTIKTRYAQTCVVTLEPVPKEDRLTIDRKFLPAAMLQQTAEPHEMLLDPEGEDPPEPLPATLDLGALVVEDLALSLDPYPRAPNAPEPDAGDAVTEKPENPFAVLKSLKF